MKEVEFNLLEEPWIRVLCPDCTIQEVSLTRALLHAQEYTDLAGELPTQDVAVLRLLLAVLQQAQILPLPVLGKQLATKTAKKFLISQIIIKKRMTLRQIKLKKLITLMVLMIRKLY